MANGPISVPCAAWSTNDFQMLFLSLGNCEAKPSERQTLRRDLHSPVYCPWPKALKTTLLLLTHPPPSPTPSQYGHFQETKPSPHLLSLTSFLPQLIDQSAVIIAGFKSTGPLVGPRLRRVPQLLILHQLPEPTGLLGAQGRSLDQIENDSDLKGWLSKTQQV